MSLPTFTDEKLEDYLNIWSRLASSDYRSKMDVTLTMDYNIERLFNPWVYTLAYGEEKRELTYNQALTVKDWLDSLKERTVVEPPI